MTPDQVATEEPRPTVDPAAREASRQIRVIERAQRKLTARLSDLETDVAQAGDLPRSTPDEEFDGWFDECCDDAEDISRDVHEAADELVILSAIYQEADDEPRLQITQQLGTHLANIDALITVLSGLPTSDGAASIAEDVSFEFDAFSEALASLG